MLLILSPKEKLLLLEYVSFLKIKFTFAKWELCNDSHREEGILSQT